MPGQLCDFIDRVRGVDFFGSTEFCQIMTKHGDDKGRFQQDYSAIESKFVGKVRGRILFALGRIQTFYCDHLDSNVFDGSVGRIGEVVRNGYYRGCRTTYGRFGQ